VDCQRCVCVQERERRGEANDMQEPEREELPMTAGETQREERPSTRERETESEKG